MLKKVLIGTVAVLVLGAIVFASLKSGGRKKGSKVDVEAVERRDLVRLVKASGQIDPRVKVNISAHVIGKIEKLYVEEGDRIEAGQPFLELEKEAFTAARDQARAQVAITQSQLRQAEINLADAQLRLRRMERLTREQIASAEQLEQAELAETSARLRLEEAKESVLQARATLVKAEDDFSKATIYAPLTGRVIALNAEEGEVVVSGTMNNPASVIGTIADLSEILAEVDVDETEVAYLEEGQDAELEVDALADRKLLGKVVEIGSSGFERPQQPDVTFFKVKILLDEPDPELRAGMSVRGRVRTAEKLAALVVPIQAVVSRPPVDEDAEEGDDSDEAASADEEADEIEVVFVFEEDEARQRPVETGISDETHVEILSGADEGEKIIVGPYRVLKDLEHEDPVRPRDEEDDDDEEDEE